MFTTIVLGLDGSDYADQALHLARERALEERARLEVVHVREVLPAAGRGGPTLYRPNEAELEAKVRQQVEELRADGIEVRLHHFSDFAGSPAHTIAEVAAETGADLIMVGTRGHGLLVGLLLGSVTHRLLEVAPCPVLAVPPPSRRRRPDAVDAERVREPAGADART
jgi:nucleotide-binding universal stress UspA family protein